MRLVLPSIFGVVLACTDATLDAAPTPPRVLDSGLDAAPDRDARPTRAGILRAATFNVHRYFDDVCESGRCGSGDYEEVRSPSQVEAITDKLARGIALLDADVVALEEVETSDLLGALKARLASLGLEYPIAHLGETGPAGRLRARVVHPELRVC